MYVYVYIYVISISLKSGLDWKTGCKMQIVLVLSLPQFGKIKRKYMDMFTCFQGRYEFWVW